MAFKVLQRFKDTLSNYLKADFEIQHLTNAVLSGFIFETIPIFGVSTILILILGPFVRANILIMQMANYLIYPIQIILYIPFLYLGRIISGNFPVNTDFIYVFEMVMSDWTVGLTKLLEIHCWAILSWGLFWLPFAIIIRPAILKGIIQIKFRIN